MALVPTLVLASSKKWGIDFVRPLPLAQGTRCQYLIVAIDYMTKWAKSMASTKNDARTAVKFLYEHIFV